MSIIRDSKSPFTPLLTGTPTMRAAVAMARILKDMMMTKTLLKNTGVAAVALLALVGGGVAIAQSADQAPGKGPRGGRGNMMMMADTNKDGTISRAEATAAAAANFQKMDTNSDGKIDQVDHEARRAQMAERRAARMAANAANDADGEGAGADRPRGDGDGERGGRGRGGRGGGFGGGMRMGGPGMAQVDTNGDKALSAAEFQIAYLARFDAMDTNKDGNVTKAEMDAHMAARKAERDAKRAAQPKS